MKVPIQVRFVREAVKVYRITFNPHLSSKPSQKASTMSGTQAGASEICTSKTCPLKFAHPVGTYKHHGQSRTRPGDEFCDSNPPPDVWASYMRITSNMDSFRDRLRVDMFIENHVEEHEELY